MTMRNSLLISAALLALASPAYAKDNPQHIPCGVYSFPDDARKTVPANHITLCFGRPMTRDEAIEYARIKGLPHATAPYCSPAVAHTFIYSGSTILPKRLCIIRACTSETDTTDCGMTGAFLCGPHECKKCGIFVDCKEK